MSKPKITNDDLCRNAKRLKTGVAEIKTFLAVETKNNGFDSQDRPVILFERHVFHKFTKGKYDKTNPGISNSVPGGYGSSASQYSRFSEAYALDPEAAMKSASWGLGQVMGFNYLIAGYSTVDDFVDGMKESEGKQLDAAVNYILHNNLEGYLREHKWASFARGYNGSGYKENAYDTKLANYYKKFSSGAQVNCGETQTHGFADIIPNTTLDMATGTNSPDSTDKDSDTSTDDNNSVSEITDDGAKPGEPTPDTAAKSGEPVVGGRPEDQAVILPQPVMPEVHGWRTFPTTIVAALGSLGISTSGALGWFWGAITDPTSQKFVFALIIIGIVIAAAYGLFYLITRAVAKYTISKQAHQLLLKEMDIRARPDLYNVKVDTRGNTSNLTSSGIPKTEDRRDSVTTPPQNS